MFNRIKSQPLGLSPSPFGFSRKCNGAGAQIFGDVFGGLAGMWSTDQANQTNKQIADNQYWYTKDLNKENRDWQSEENKQARTWQEQMYNLYNSPSAMMRQYREAGLNPYMVGQGGAGSGGSAPSSPAMSGSPSAGGVSMGHPAVPYDMSFIGDSIARYMQAKQVDASAADQTAKAEYQYIKNYQELSKMNSDYAYEYLVTHMQALRGTHFDADRFVNEFDYKLASDAANASLAKLYNDIEHTYGKSKAANFVANQEQEFNKMAAEIRKMASDASVNDADIALKAAQMVEAYAKSNNLNADTQTINALRNHLANIYQKQSLSANDVYGETHSEYEANELVRGYMKSQDSKIRRREVHKINGPYNTRRATIQRNVEAVRGMNTSLPPARGY